jgi:protein TonB
MNPQAIPAVAVSDGLETENDRFKQSFGSWFWGSMIAATVVHFMLFQFWPTLTAEDVSFTVEELEMIELPPEIEIPPPPEAISRPATPVMATADIDDDITIAPTTFADNPIEDLPPPPTDDRASDISAAPVFTPMTVRPEIRNRPEVQAALKREYPSLLRDAGIGGTVVVWFFISEEGMVADRRVSQTSGQAQFDEAALRVADVIRFSPALNRDKRVRVWIEVPITFTVLSAQRN